MSNDRQQGHPDCYKWSGLASVLNQPAVHSADEALSFYRDYKRTQDSEWRDPRFEALVVLNKRLERMGLRPRQKNEQLNQPGHKHHGRQYFKFRLGLCDGDRNPAITHWIQSALHDVFSDVMALQPSFADMPVALEVVPLKRVQRIDTMRKSLSVSSSIKFKGADFEDTLYVRLNKDGMGRRQEGTVVKPDDILPQVEKLSRSFAKSWQRFERLRKYRAQKTAAEKAKPVAANDVLPTRPNGSPDNRPDNTRGGSAMTLQAG